MKACDKSYGYHHYAILVSMSALDSLGFNNYYYASFFQHVVVVAFDDAQCACFQNSASIPAFPHIQWRTHFLKAKMIMLVSKQVHLTLWVFNYFYASFPTCCCCSL
jgi:hypothetical protein